MKKLVQDLVKHPYGQLCQLQQGEASSIRTLPAIQTAFALSEGNCSGEVASYK